MAITVEMELIVGRKLKLLPHSFNRSLTGQRRLPVLKDHEPNGEESSGAAVELKTKITGLIHKHKH